MFEEGTMPLIALLIALLVLCDLNLNEFVLFFVTYLLVFILLVYNKHYYRL